ncbi:histidine phosphatase family protein [Bradyrhizobium sp. LHD-71]|uniref:histidine phosphatase family protein n=1 Tax=Bradyrhizobium sp. LHD-71 TaxID=3072141 RepID=UPI00280CBA3B|nr:histidine phosphatase family protein [Bradyrhizobium sp. LHD-71]MDQ8731996.1 histidine phosphatase family protein [Bradyrhizobium sp. LHD-71]
MSSPVIYYVRHGETAWNAEGRFQGSRDIPLNARGRVQAEAAGGILRDLIVRDAREPQHFGYVSSPLSRARVTMDLLRGALGLPANSYKVEHRLREIGWGVWEGLTVPEMEAHDPVAFAARHKDRWGTTAPGGETYAEVAVRMRAWLSELTSDTVAVAHGGTMRALMVATGVATALEAVEAQVEQGVVYVFAGGRLTKYA